MQPRRGSRSISLRVHLSVDSRNFKKWGRSPTTAKIVGEGLKILGDDFMINFKVMENTFTVYLAIFNSGHVIGQGHLANHLFTKVNGTS